VGGKEPPPPLPIPHTPVTLLSAAHSGSARPTPTELAKGPAGILSELMDEDAALSVG
jgi:hypothetical protein